jgi:hypothetical protein
MIQRIFTMLLLLAAPLAGFAQQAPEGLSPEQQLLQRIYEMRMRVERDRANNENAARANVRLVTQTPDRAVDAPTVTAMRAQTHAELARYEQRFRCLDVNVEPNGGNTVVICGDNSGDISGTNVSADRDIVTVQGGQP